ncbi:putative Kinase [Zostera marina]|uniref:non-specific serine/threonine protein kinase n=1 Tax=Zostera marina TaxID=29655 RepID=A0A0K9Q0E8_ZOSMR|nr:putative Kinase [Zostera marina]
MLSGSIPDWILDISYNSFNGSANNTTILANHQMNLVASYSPSVKNLTPSCLSKNLTCTEKAMSYELYINCGGQNVTVDGKVYQSDKAAISNTTSFYSYGKWAISSTGYFVGDSNAQYIAEINESLLLNTINSQLYKSARLNPLSLRYYALCMQSGNYTVNLHFAEIMFSEFGFSSNGRRIFDVSIQGKKVLENFDITKKAGGVRRGVVLSFTTLISAISITPNFTPKKEDSGGGLLNAAVPAILVSTCIFFIIIFVVLFISQKKKHVKSEELKSFESMTDYFSLQQIKTATKNFAPENKIGEGGFGSVYKGTLNDGTLIAVKQLSSKSRQGNREFINKVGMISAFQHPNLVKLFGCCVEGNQLLVIYEYMENNSLARALFGPEEVNLSLDWPTRSKICMDIARGTDIKVTNVLLDSDLNAKISDFGLAKLDEGEDTHISTRIAGTIGYMAPEYAMRGYLTDKADVYSFGIVVLELVSGKSNTNFRPKEDSVFFFFLQIFKVFVKK